MNKFSIAKNRLLCTAVFITTLAFVLFYGGRVPYALFYTVIALITVSLLYLLIVCLFCNVQCQLDRRDVIKGGDIILTIEIRNNSPLFIPYVNITYKKTIAFNYKKLDEALSITAFTGKRARIALTSKYRGRYDVNIPEVRLMDFLGLINVPVKYAKLPDVLVYPHICEIDEFSAVGKFDMDNQLHPDNISEDITAVSDVREYMIGDEMRKIHWNLSARMMSFMSKNYENITKSRLTMLINLSRVSGTSGASGASGASAARRSSRVSGVSGSSRVSRASRVSGASGASTASGASVASVASAASGYSEEERLSLEDRILETAVSIIYHFLYKYWNVTLCYYENDYFTYSLEDASMFEMAYDHLAFVEFSSDYNVARIVENISQDTAGEYLNLCVVTHEVSDDLIERIIRYSELGSRIALVYVCKSKTGLEKEDWAKAVRKSAVSLFLVDFESGLREALASELI